MSAEQRRVVTRPHRRHLGGLALGTLAALSWVAAAPTAPTPSPPPSLASYRKHYVRLWSA